MGFKEFGFLYSLMLLVGKCFQEIACMKTPNTILDIPDCGKKNCYCIISCQDATLM